MVEWNNSKIAVISGLFLMGAIIAYLLIPMSQENTIILTTPSGTVNSCANPNLVLAQNLTDLCDVTIVSPSTNQILQYNGSQWINVAQVTFNDTTSCNNLGDGVILCRDGNINMKTLEPLEGIAITNDSQKVYIANNGVLSVSNATGIECDTIAGDVTCSNTAPESTVCANLGAIGEGIYVSGNCNFKKLVAGSGVSLASNGTRITISATGSESTVCSGQSGNYNIVASSSSGNCIFKNLRAGTGETLSSNSTHITITNSSPESTVCTNLGTVGEGLYVSGNCNFKKLLAGSGITLSSNGTRITITNTNVAESTTCTDLGTVGVGLCGSSGDITIEKLLAGTGISLSDNNTRVTVTNTLPEQGCTSAGGTTLLKTGSTCDFKGLTTGPGITVTSNTNDNQIKTNFVNGTAIRITGSSAQTITNTGVTSLSSGDTNTLTFDASTGAITATPVIKKLCEVVASGGETTLTCTLSASQQYLAIFGATSSSSGTTNVHRLRFNGDTGNNYAYRTSTNGGADSTLTSTNGIQVIVSGDSANRFNYIFFRCEDHASGEEKTCEGSRNVSATGAGNAPSRVEYATKWANTANDITSVSIERTAGSGTFEAGNFLTVWGYS